MQKSLPSMILISTFLLAAAPARGQMMNFPGEWGWLDPVEWGKHLIPGVESKWERADREYQERLAAEAADKKYRAELAEARTRRRKEQARRMGVPEALSWNLEDAFSYPGPPFTKVEDFEPAELEAIAWVALHHELDHRAGEATAVLVDSLARSRKEGSGWRPFDPTLLLGALRRVRGGRWSDPRPYGLEFSARDTPPAAGDLEAMGLSRDGRWSEPEAQRFAARLSAYHLGLPREAALREALALKPGLRYHQAGLRMGYVASEWIAAVNAHRKALGDPRFPLLPVLPDGLRAADEFLRAQSPAKALLPEWPRIEAADGGAGAPDEAAPPAVEIPVEEVPAGPGPTVGEPAGSGLLGQDVD